MGKKLSVFAGKLASDRYYLKEPVMNFDSEEGRTNDMLYGATCVQGWRRRQEDQYKCISNFIPGYSYFAVFDGHGGPEVAKYLKKELHNYIFNNLIDEDVELALYMGFLSCDYSLKDPFVLEELKLFVENQSRSLNDETAESLPGTSGENLVSKKDFVPLSESSESEGEKKTHESQLDISDHNKSSDDDVEPETSQNKEKVLDVLSFLTNDELAESEDDDDSDFTCEDDEDDEEHLAFEDVAELAENEKDDDAFRPGFDSGSTATVVITTERMVYMANVGDSRCVLSSKGKAIDMSVDHKPEDEEEKRRIISSGARVVGDRIDSMLNLSRAFGDFNFKKETLDEICYSVIAEPFILQIPRSIEMDFIVLASDGIWNSMDSQAVVDFVSLRLSCGAKPKHISEELCHFIVAEDGDGNDDGTGKDNMSCIIIVFKDYQNEIASTLEIVTDVIPLQKDPENDEVEYLFETKSSKSENNKLHTKKLSLFPNCNEGHEDHDSVQKEIDTEENICSENVIADYEHSKDSYDCNSSDAIGTNEKKVFVDEGMECLTKIFPNCNEGLEDHDSMQKEVYTGEKICSENVITENFHSDAAIRMKTATGESSADYEHSKDSYDCNSSDAVETNEKKVFVDEGMECLSKTIEKSCEVDILQKTTSADEKYTSGGETSEDNPNCEEGALKNNGKTEETENNSEQIHVNVDDNSGSCKGIKRNCEELQNSSKKLKEQ